MKKAVVAIVVLASLLCLCIIYQNHNQLLLTQSVNDWQSRVAVANLKGKNSDQVAAFLDQQGVVHNKYWSGMLVDDRNHTRRKFGDITGHVGPVAHTFSKDGWQVWYIGLGFNFDGNNKCTDTIITWHPNWF